MKLLKIFGLVALAALTVTAFVGAGTAMATGSTALCKDMPTEDDEGIDGEDGVCDDIITRVHETTLSDARAKILTKVLNIECDVLFLGDALVKLANPLVILGTLTYANCNNNCVVFEENSPGEHKFLWTGHETAKATFEYQVHVECGILIDCIYNGVGLEGTAKGALLSSHFNGELIISGKVLNPIWGLCPSVTRLDIVLVPLIVTYIGL